MSLHLHLSASLQHRLGAYIDSGQRSLLRRLADTPVRLISGAGSGVTIVTAMFRQTVADSAPGCIDKSSARSRN